MINGNDNSSSSWLLMGNPKLEELLAPSISLADWLIAKHCTKWWKNQPATFEYQSAQHGLCTVLVVPRSSKQSTCDFLAIYLDCEALRMMNDPETLERIPEFTPEHMILARKLSEDFSSSSDNGPDSQTS